MDYGLKHRDLKAIEAVGADEIQYGKGHRYLTLVCQIDRGSKRLLSVTRERTVKSLLRGLRRPGRSNLQGVQ